jgi:hypothetical protein
MTAWGSRRTVVGGAMATAVLLATLSAHADERAQCAAAADQAQQLRDEGKYRRAREQMYACARDVCPTPIKRDCLQWIGELDNLAPTVVFAAKRGSQDLYEVKVSMDGVKVADRLDGKPVFVDLGEHTFKFEHEGEVREEKAVIAAGQKLRSINVTFGAPAETPAATPAAGPASTTSPPPGEERSGSVVPAVVVGGIGIVALGAFALFGIQGKNDVDDLQKCKPSCREQDVDDARTKLIIADISLGVGIVALGVATYMFLTRPKIDSNIQTTAVPRLRLQAGPISGGAAAGFGGAF